MVEASRVGDEGEVLAEGLRVAGLGEAALQAWLGALTPRESRHVTLGRWKAWRRHAERADRERGALWFWGEGWEGRAGASPGRDGRKRV